MTYSVIDMLHVTRCVHVSMKWHAMTYALHLCMGHHVESGVSAWLGSVLCLVFDHGKSIFWTTSNGVSRVHFNCF